MNENEYRKITFRNQGRSRFWPKDHRLGNVARPTRDVLFRLVQPDFDILDKKLTNHCSTDIEMETVCCPSWSMNPSSQAKTVFFHFSIMLRIILVPPCTAQPQKCIHFFKKNLWCCTSVSDLFENALLRRWKERKTASSGIQTQTSWLWGFCFTAAVFPLSSKSAFESVQYFILVAMKYQLHWKPLPLSSWIYLKSNHRYYFYERGGIELVTRVQPGTMSLFYHLCQNHCPEHSIDLTQFFST